jgi:hypothetical protein
MPSSPLTSSLGYGSQGMPTTACQFQKCQQQIDSYLEVENMTRFSVSIDRLLKCAVA